NPPVCAVGACPVGWQGCPGIVLGEDDSATRSPRRIPGGEIPGGNSGPERIGPIPLVKPPAALKAWTREQASATRERRLLIFRRQRPGCAEKDGARPREKCHGWRKRGGALRRTGWTLHGGQDLAAGGPAAYRRRDPAQGPCRRRQ